MCLFVLEYLHSGNEFLGRPISQKSFYLWSEGVQLAFAGSLRPSQLHSRRFFCSESLFRPLRNEIFFNFRRHWKCHGNDFALDAMVQLPVALHGVDINPFLSGNWKNFHTFEHASTQSGKLTNHDIVSILKLFQNIRDLPLPHRYLTRNFLLDKKNLSQVFGICQL